MKTDLAFEAEPFAWNAELARHNVPRPIRRLIRPGPILRKTLPVATVKRAITAKPGPVAVRPIRRGAFGRRGATPAKMVAAAPVGRQVERVTVSRFPRYKNEVASLPPEERQKIDQAARLVAESYARDRRPITTIRFIGHADFDTPRRPVFELQVSAQRASNVMRALRAAVDREGARLIGSGGPLSARLRWQRFSLGAAVPVVRQPRHELDRSRNRRVDILLESEQRLASAKDLISFPLVAEITQPQPPTCTNPSPKQSVSISRPGITINANIVALSFNASTIGTIQQVITKDTNKVIGLRFSCHRVIAQSAGCTDVIPAWKFAADFTSSSTSEDPKDWEIGFIQTIASHSIRHVYTGGTRVCTISKPTRDATKGSNAPWYDSLFVHALDAGKNPIMEDSPNTDALLKHSKLGDLRQVCVEGMFQIWLAARKTGASGPLMLLGFREIEVARNWTFIPGRNPEDTSAWVHRGGQREKRQGSGNDRKLPRPELTGSTANDQQSTCFRDDASAKALCPESVPEFTSLCMLGRTCP